MGTVSFRIILASVNPGWEVIPPEDIFVKKKLKAKVQKAIDEAVEAILAGEESSHEEGFERGRQSECVHYRTSAPTPRAEPTR